MKTTGAVAASLLLCTLSAFASIFDFETPGQFTNNFAVLPDSTLGNSYVQFPIGGLNNGGSLGVLAGSPSVTARRTAILTTESFDFSVGTDMFGRPFRSEVEVSAIFNFLPALEGAQGNLLQLGFVDKPTSALDEQLGTSFMSLSLNRTTGVYTYTPELEFYNANGVAAKYDFANITLQPMHWYGLYTTFVTLGPHEVQASALITDFGLLGIMGFPDTIFAPRSFSDVDLSGSTNIWAAFRASRETGLATLDDVAAFGGLDIPEPSSLVLLTVGAGVLFFVRARTVIR